MPLTIKGERDGSFRKINPSLQTVVSSWTSICRALSKAPNEWWKEADNYDNNEEEDKSDGEGEMIDLQTGKPDDASEEGTFATAETGPDEEEYQ